MAESDDEGVEVEILDGDNNSSTHSNRSNIVDEGGLIGVIVAPGTSHQFIQTLRVGRDTTVQDAAEKLAERLRLPLSDLQHYNLIVVYETAAGNVRLKTVPPDASVGLLRRDIMAGLPPCELCGGSRLLAEQGCQACSSTVRWFFKDSRTAPLELDVDMSGSEKDEEEECVPEISAKDVPYLLQGGQSDYLLIQSRKDPNLWRKKWCVLTEDKLWIFQRKPEPRRGGGKVPPYMSLSLAATTVTKPSGPGVIPHVVELHCSHICLVMIASPQWVTYFEAATKMASDNDLIHVAEHIIRDEMYARCVKANAALLERNKPAE